MARQKTTASGLMVTVGMGADAPPLMVVVDAVSQRRPGSDKATGLSYACPHPIPVEVAPPEPGDPGDIEGLLAGDGEHTPSRPCGARVSQAYICTAGPDHRPDTGFYTAADMGRGRMIGQTLVPVTEAEVEAVKAADVEAGALSFRALPAADVDAATRPGGYGYRLRLPAKKVTRQHRVAFTVLRRLAESPDVAYLCEAVVKGSPKLYRLGVWQGQPTITEVIWPEDMAPVDEDLDYEPIAPERLDAIAARAAAAVEPFDAAEWRNGEAERMAELDRRKAANPDVVIEMPERPPAEAPPADVDALLDAWAA